MCFKVTISNFTLLEPTDESQDLDWTIGLLRKRDLTDKQNRMSLGKAVKTGSEKRKEEGEGTGRKRSKKKKYENIGEDWGLCEGTGGAVECFLYSGLEGVKVTKDEDVKDYSAVKKRKKGKNEQALEIITESNRKITDWTMRDMENINCVGRGGRKTNPPYERCWTFDG